MISTQALTGTPPGRLRQPWYPAARILGRRGPRRRQAHGIGGPRRLCQRGPRPQSVAGARQCEGRLRRGGSASLPVRAFAAGAARQWRVDRRDMGPLRVDARRGRGLVGAAAPDAVLRMRSGSNHSELNAIAAASAALRGVSNTLSTQKLTFPPVARRHVVRRLQHTCVLALGLPVENEAAAAVPPDASAAPS